MLATLNPIHDSTPAVPQVSDGHFRHASNVSRVRHIEVLPFDTTGYRRLTGAWFLRSFGLSPACSSFPAAPSSSAPVAPPFISPAPRPGCEAGLPRRLISRQREDPPPRQRVYRVVLVLTICS